MTKPQSLDQLRNREAALVERLTDRSLSRQSKRHVKRALQRIRAQIKEAE